ncbi:MAG: enoyl-CoA hydratase-related protein [Kiritimatiellia bacterium]
MTSNLQLSRESGGLAVITFDRPGAGANIFDLATLDELGAALDTLEAAPPRALMLVSAKPKIFFAGADIQGFSAVRDAAEARALARKGQDLFNRIAGLPCPTVAAIHGQALGGGCEMALACDWRVLSDSRDTRIGLPEILLGILPAWGGSHRLPRLIGPCRRSTSSSPAKRSRRVRRSNSAWPTGSSRANFWPQPQPPWPRGANPTAKSSGGRNFPCCGVPFTGRRAPGCWRRRAGSIRRRSRRSRW